MEGSRSSNAPITKKPPSVRPRGPQEPSRGIFRQSGSNKPEPDGRRLYWETLARPAPGAGKVWQEVLRPIRQSPGVDAAEGIPLTELDFIGSPPAIINRYSSESERTVALIPEGVRHRIEEIMKKSGSEFNPDEISPCPFTDMEIAELEAERDPMDASKPREMLVFLPKKLGPAALCEMWGMQSNLNFEVDSLVRTVMKAVDQWFIASTSRVPEHMYKTGDWIIEFYNRKRFMSGEQRLHGMDIRRYITFAGYHRELFGQLPDEAYWNFLWGASYDRSGILVSGFKRGILNSHGWMKNWHAKFCGSRYITLAPREEINPETEHLRRVYRYQFGERVAPAEIDPKAPESGMN